MCGWLPGCFKRRHICERSGTDDGAGAEVQHLRYQMQVKGYLDAYNVDPAGDTCVSSFSAHGTLHVKGGWSFILHSNQDAFTWSLSCDEMLAA